MSRKNSQTAAQALGQLAPEQQAGGHTILSARLALWLTLRWCAFPLYADLTLLKRWTGTLGLDVHLGKPRAPRGRRWRNRCR
jgi:hypothetical protein